MKRIAFILLLLCCAAAHAQLLQFMQAAFGPQHSQHSQQSPGGIYVSSLTGSGSNAGTSNAPIATLAQACILANDQPTNIYLQRGSVFYESFHVPDNSTVQAYGTGAKPIVDGTLPLSSSVGSWTLVTGNTWSLPLSRSLLWSTNPIEEFACSNVLMVWQTVNGTTTNGTYRLGARWDLNAGYASTPGSLANVEANVGSFYYDTNAQILYINPLGDRNPTNSGDTYAASIRTLAVWGGTNFNVSDVEGRFAYAYDSEGNEGYQADATGYGRFYHCRFHGGWNHIAGYADNYGGGWPASGLVFDSCDIYDGDAAISPGICIAFNGGPAQYVPNFLWTNCLVYQWGTEGSGSSVGFYAHQAGDSTLTEQIVNCTVTNVSGFAGLPFATLFYGNTWMDTNYGDQAIGDVPNSGVTTVSNCVFWAWHNQHACSIGFSNNAVFVNNLFWGGAEFEFTAGYITFNNNIFAGTNGYSMQPTLPAGDGFVTITNNTFEGQTEVYGGAVNTNTFYSDYNDYYTNYTFGSYPSTYFTYAQWTNQWPSKDLHSTTNNPNLNIAPLVIGDPAGP